MGDYYFALSERRDKRIAKHGNYKRHYNKALEVVLFYKENYKNLTLKHYDRDKVGLLLGERNIYNKAWHYRRKAYTPIINEAFEDFKAIHNRLPKDDNEMYDFLCSKLLKTVFSQAELDIWKHLLLYIHQQGIFTAVKRSDRRTKHTESTYYDFALWWQNNKDDYTSKDRYIVTGFVAYCKQSKIDVSRTKIDDMLRYDAYPECFIDGDLDALGLVTQQQRDDFFATLQLIKDTQKK